MKIPQFTAEASLGQAVGKYRVGSFGRSLSAAVLPMQAATAAPGFFSNWPRPWEKLVPCCYDDNGRPVCTYYAVPVWYWCERLPTRFTCFVCFPPENRLPWG